MKFIRVDKDSGDEPDALDRFFGLFQAALRESGRPANAVAPQAAGLIRHVSQVITAGGSADAAAALGLVTGPARGVLRLEPVEAGHLIGAETRRLLEASTPAVESASVDRLRRRLDTAFASADREVALLTLLDANKFAGHLSRGREAPPPDAIPKLKEVLRGTEWLTPLPDHDKLCGHLRALLGTQGNRS